MPHKFGNFAAAYAHLESRWTIARNFQNQAYSYADSGEWKWAIYSTLSAFDNLLENLNFDIDSSVYGECLYWASQEGGNGIDMDTILSTMLSASFNQLQKFIGIEDAYRVAIWNAPFNANFYASLARGFQKWP